AAQPVATAQAEIFDSQFERRHCGILTDLLCSKLVYCDAKIRLRADPGVRAAQKCRSRTRVVRSGRTAAIGLRMTHIADDVDAIAEQLQQLKNFRKFKVRSFAFRSPLVHGGAVREVNGAESRLSCRGRLPHRCGGRNHGFQKRQSNRYTNALKESAS